MKTKISETATLLKEPDGEYLAFTGSREELKEYIAWYRRVNKGCVSIITTSLFVIHVDID